MDRSPRGLNPGVALLLLPVLASIAHSSSPSPRVPEPRSACPVCDMFVAPHPEWLAQIVLGDGTAVFFDGCKDLFTYLLDPDRFESAATADRIAAIYVTGYYDQTAFEARAAFFVLGSDIHGPMGKELVPLRDLGEAEDFMRDHRGAAVLRFEDIDAEVLASLH